MAIDSRIHVGEYVLRSENYNPVHAGPVVRTQLLDGLRYGGDISVHIVVEDPVGDGGVLVDYALDVCGIFRRNRSVLVCISI